MSWQVKEVKGYNMFLLPMEEEDQTGGMVVLLEKISSSLMENMCTGMTQTCLQEKVTGYVRIPLAEILILLGGLTVTTATRNAMHLPCTSPATVLTDASSTLHHKGHRVGLLVHRVAVICQGRNKGIDHHRVVGVWSDRMIIGTILRSCPKIVQDEWQTLCTGTGSTSGMNFHTDSVGSLTGMAIITGSIHAMDHILTEENHGWDLPGVIGDKLYGTEVIHPCVTSP